VHEAIDTPQGRERGGSPEAVAQMDVLLRDHSNWGRWGEHDQAGTVNLLTPERTAAAARLVRSGETVSLARRLTTRATPDNPDPMLHFMTNTADDGRPDASGTAGDWFGLRFHGFAVSHVDALSHLSWRRQMYNGVSVDTVTARGGAAVHSVETMARGVVTRGVLLDVARVKGIDWIAPGDGLDPQDLEECEREHGVTVRPGDVLVFRTGRDVKTREQGAHHPMDEGNAGLYSTCVPWLRERDVAFLGSDVAQDVMFPAAPPHLMPVHVGALVGLGLPLLDNLAVEDLADACARTGRYEFCFTMGPLPLQRTTGSPVNPIVVL